MVSISISGDMVVFQVEGLDRLWAFKSRLEIPARNIREVHPADPAIARGWWKGIRAPGTHIPGIIIAGTYFQDRKRIFWDVHDPENAIVVELSGNTYDRLIVEVENPEEAIRTIEEAMAPRTAE